MPRCLYFGCRTGESGHFLYEPGFRKIYQATADYPFEWTTLDGRYAPEGDVREARRKTRAGREELQGVARTSYLNGWSLVGFWDRSQDRRGASNSVLLIESTLLTFDELLAAHRPAFPSIWARFGFDVVPWDGR